jgi:hypothetical protein
MSYTQFVATAKCQVPADFNLQSYLDELSVRCVKEENSIFEFYGLDSNDELDVDFADYVRVLDSDVLIECDSEELNSNSEVWDWLCDQFRKDVMTGMLMEINSATIDSRSGLDSFCRFYTKSGHWIDSYDILRILEEVI